jgi:hypothetical protein
MLLNNIVWMQLRSTCGLFCPIIPFQFENKHGAAWVTSGSAASSLIARWPGCSRCWAMCLLWKFHCNCFHISSDTVFRILKFKFEGRCGLVVNVSDLWSEHHRVRYPSRTTSLVTLGKSIYFYCLVLRMRRKTDIPCTWVSMPVQAKDPTQEVIV